MHFIEACWDYLDTQSRVCFACSCVEFYDEVSKHWKHVIIPPSIPVNDNNLMPILVCAQNIESLTIEFPFDEDQEKESQQLLLSQQSVFSNNKNGIKFPAQCINPSYLPHLKNITKIDVKTCAVSSYESFVCGLLLQLPKFLQLAHLCLPQLFSLRHSTVDTLDIHQLQIGFDGMNVHLGADLIGVTHLKRQLPRLTTILCDEMYLFVGEDIYVDREKSHQRYWFMMRKWAQECRIQIVFKNTSIAIMLMPSDKSTPPLIHDEWENIKPWFQDRLGSFLRHEDDEIIKVD